ncbi:unnamed protein product [Closterium sp. NIES-64]|nr:unnamed protein product [Closterium sp. NIES-64]
MTVKLTRSRFPARPLSPPPANDYCIYQSVSYAVGTTSITASYACPNCTCSRLSGAAGASCECEPGPRCRVDVAGKPVKKVNVGTCTHPAMSAGQCVSAGPGWGPIFYSSGVASGAIRAGNMCQRCACTKGQFSNCRRIKGCKMCVPKKGAGEVTAQCVACCKGAQGDANVKACLAACGRVTL